jgi:hypothetical protein
MTYFGGLFRGSRTEWRSRWVLVEGRADESEIDEILTDVECPAAEVEQRIAYEGW